MDTVTFDDELTFIPKPSDLSDRMLLETMYRFIAEMKHNADVATDAIELDTRSLKKIINMKERTVCRWRSNNMLRFHVRQDNTLYYKYRELYVDVKSGRINGRNFDRIETLRRLALYREGVLKGRNPLEWMEEAYSQVLNDYDYNKELLETDS